MPSDTTSGRRTVLTTPFTADGKKLIADNIYAHAWQQVMSGAFARQ